MKRTLRRLTAAAAAVSALGAGAAVTASPASARTDVQRCGLLQLKVTLAYGQGGGAGNFYWYLDFQNTGHYTCQLYGYPGVSAIDANGTQLGPAAGRSPYVPPQYVDIMPGRTAHAILHYTQAQNYNPSACKPEPATDLRVYPPGDTYSVKLPFSSDVCTTNIDVLSVTRVRPGA